MDQLQELVGSQGAFCHIAKLARKVQVVEREGPAAAEGSCMVDGNLGQSKKAVAVPAEGCSIFVSAEDVEDVCAQFVLGEGRFLAIDQLLLFEAHHHRVPSLRGDLHKRAMGLTLKENAGLDTGLHSSTLPSGHGPCSCQQLSGKTVTISRVLLE